jgi:hypothetical protein
MIKIRSCFKWERWDDQGHTDYIGTNTSYVVWLVSYKCYPANELINSSLSKAFFYKLSPEKCPNMDSELPVSEAFATILWTNLLLNRDDNSGTDIRYSPGTWPDGAGYGAGIFPTCGWPNEYPMLCYYYDSILWTCANVFILLYWLWLVLMVEFCYAIISLICWILVMNVCILWCTNWNNYFDIFLHVEW